MDKHRDGIALNNISAGKVAREQEWPLLQSESGVVNG